MHARNLVEIAGWISVHNRALLAGCAATPDEALAEYWIASRCRLDGWGRALRRLSDSRTASPSGGAELSALGEEIILSDVLTRAVAAIACELDSDSAAIGRNTFNAHTESMSRLRSLTFVWWPGDSDEARSLRSLSAAAERWNDVLLAHFDPSQSIDRLAYDKERTGEFRADGKRRRTSDLKAVSALIRLAIQTSFSGTTPPVCGDLNRRIGGAALGLFGSEAFDGFGLPRSVWMIRAERSTDEAIAMLDTYIADDFHRGESPKPHRWRI